MWLEGEGKRARGENREILRGRPFRALWAKGRILAFTASEMGAMGGLGAGEGCELG